MLVPKLQSPIVLVHGVLGYDEIRVGNWTVARYFPDIPEYLGAAGNRVLVARLSPTGSVAQRAAQLKAFLNREVPHEPVHLFAHSMGGLDSRYLVSRLDMSARVLSLTTLGTPHRGSPFADWGLRRFESLVQGLCNLFDVALHGFHDLTTARCRAFNQQVPDAPGVRYFSVAGQWERHWPHPGWELTHRIVRAQEGPNDGVVSLASARYGESCEVWDADHLSLINWKNLTAHMHGIRHDRITPFARLVRRLADEGF